jgi:D-amino peptidase
MRLFVSVDIEGVAGVVTRDQTSAEGFEYQQARDWMTDEAAAACQAAFAAGVAEIVMADGHGNFENLKPDRLPERVQLVRGKPRPLSMMQGIEIGTYGGALFLGYHAGSTAEGGVLAHTMRGNVLREVRLNGKTMSESGVNAAIAGDYGVPVIAISGDDAYVKEAKGLLGDVEAATVKWTDGFMAARSLSPAASRDAIGKAVTRAVKRIGDFKPYRVSRPITLDLDFKFRLPVELLAMLRFVERTGPFGIRYVAQDMTEVSKFLVCILGYSASLA